MKRLALVALFALPMVMTGCEKLGDATGPNMSQAPSAAPSAAKGGNAAVDSISTKPGGGGTNKGIDIGWP
jgi:hypothetical protein